MVIFRKTPLPFGHGSVTAPNDNLLIMKILFVHGTGVRLLDFTRTLRIIKNELKEFDVQPCLWGDVCGAKLHLDGASIPDYEESSAGQPPSADEVEKARWFLLYQDPLFELRLLEGHPPVKTNRPPNMEQPGAQAVRLARELQPPAGYFDLLKEMGISEHWPEAYRAVVDAPQFDKLLRRANREPMETSLAVARALVASLLSHAAPVSVGAARRKLLIDPLIDPLGGRPRGIWDWVSHPLHGIATVMIRSRRQSVFDGHASKMTDILLYQARGGPIRDFIRERIQEIEEDVIVVAHSLGGVACVDLLVMEGMPNVKALITVASQAPFFYETGALVSLPFGEKLPSHFPERWLNIYDPSDFLSYRGALVFRGSLEDKRVDNGEPFPESHSAYWDNPEVWESIRRFIRNAD